MIWSTQVETTQITIETPLPADEIPVRVQAITGAARDDAWIRRRPVPLRQRLLDAGRFAVIGLTGGAVFLLVPLVHLLGILFALTMLTVAAARLRAATVVQDAGGTCPRCGHAGAFFAGVGRRRFRLPLKVSCQGCGVELSLNQ
jgi:hypothetical protein